MKKLLDQALALAEKHIPVIVGAVASLVVLGASDLHIVISNASVAEVLTPVVTAGLVDLDKALGATSKVVAKARSATK